MILSTNSIASEWCKKELNSSLVRELAEKQVLILPCVIDDCEIPLFLRDKLYADFRKNPDDALRQLDDSLLRITSQQQGRIETPDFHTDWAFDWKQGRTSGLWYFEWVFVDHGEGIEYCVLTRCQIACNESASRKFQVARADVRQELIRKALESLVHKTSGMRLKIRLEDAFEKFEVLVIDGGDGDKWFVELGSRRMGIDNGKDTLIHVDQILERALESMPKTRVGK